MSCLYQCLVILFLHATLNILARYIHLFSTHSVLVCQFQDTMLRNLSVFHILKSFSCLTKPCPRKVIFWAKPESTKMGNINMPTPPLAQLWCYLFAFNFGCNENVNSLHPRELVIVYYVLQAKYHSSFGISSPDSLSHFFLIQLEVLFLFSIMALQREEKRLFWDYSLCRSQLSALLVYPIPYYSLFFKLPFKIDPYL